MAGSSIDSTRDGYRRIPGNLVNKTKANVISNARSRGVGTRSEDLTRLPLYQSVVQYCAIRERRKDAIESSPASYSGRRASISTPYTTATARNRAAPKSYSKKGWVGCDITQTLWHVHARRTPQKSRRICSRKPFPHYLDPI
jgi:hypothetical protein